MAAAQSAAAAGLNRLSAEGVARRRRGPAGRIARRDIPVSIAFRLKEWHGVGDPRRHVRR